MTAIAGTVGAVYWTPTYTAITISFADQGPDEIRDSANGFVTQGFVAGNVYTVTGSTSNNDDFTVDTVAAGTLTLGGTETLTVEAAGDTVTIKAALPGVVLTQFFNWSLTNSVEALDSTNFSHVGIAHYTAGIYRWTVTADKFWNDSTVNQQAWKGTDKIVQLYTRYNATPTTTNAYYFTGTGLVEGINIDAPVEALVTQNMTLVGNGALPIGVTRSTAWKT